MQEKLNSSQSFLELVLSQDPLSPLLASTMVQFVGGAEWEGDSEQGRGLANRVHLTWAGGISIVVLILQDVKVNIDVLMCKLCDRDCTTSKQ